MAFSILRTSLWLLNGGTSNFSAYYALFMTLGAAWIAWYVWAFAIVPKLDPREPKQAPYLIPFVGHAVRVFRDSESLFTRCRNHFKNTRDPFAITVMGQRLYIITSPNDVSKVYKNTGSLEFDTFAKQMFKSFGVTDDGMRKMWQAPPLTKGSSSGERTKPLIHAGSDYYRLQLLPGQHLDELWSKVQGLFENALRWDAIPETCRIEEAKDELRVSLLQLCRITLMTCVSNGMYGPALLQLNPDLLDRFTFFDLNAWKINFQLPLVFSKEAHRAKDDMIQALMKYFDLLQDQRQDAAWLLSILEHEMIRSEMQLQDLVIPFTTAFWVINSNAYKLAFWVLSYILYDPDLHSQIEAEIQQKLCKDGFPPPEKLELCINQCGLLQSIYHEVLRINTASATVRSVVSDTELGFFLLRKGATVLVPYRQMHFETSVFGHDAAKFEATRFLENEGLDKSSSFRPFGGGTTHCSGHIFAKREVLCFVAMILYRYHVTVPKTMAERGRAGTQQRFPKCDEKLPSLGVLPPMEGEDLQINIQERKRV